MSNRTLVSVQCFTAIIITTIIYGIFITFYKSTLVHHVLNPYVGIVILVVVLLAVLVMGFILSFKLTEKWS